MKLENWSVCLSGDAYTAPELRRQCLVGKVSGHARFGEGEEIMTTAISGKRCGLVVTVSGSAYELGEVSPQYEQQFPNAKERLLETLPEIPAIYPVH